MSTTDSTTINPEQLRELHLNALQSLYNLDDQTIGAVEVILAIELAHWDITNTVALTDLHNFIRARKPSLDAHFSVGDEALDMIKALEEHNSTLAEKLAAAQKELEALRANYANLSDILLGTERERDQLNKTLEAAGSEISLLREAFEQTKAELTTAKADATDKQAAIDAIGLAIVDSIMQEAGTAAAANPPAPSTPAQTHAANLISPVTPAPYSPSLAKLAGEVDAAAAQFQATNGNGHNGSNGSNGSNNKPGLVSHPTAFLFPTTEMTREMQALVQALRTEQIEWISLTTEQKKQLGIEVAAEILVQTGSAQTDLSRELFDSQKPTWIPTMHALCLGAPISASYLRASAATLAAARLHNQQPSEDASQAPSQEADQDASQDQNQDASQSSASSSDGSAPSSSD